MTDHQHHEHGNRFDEAAATWDDDHKLERTRRVAALLRERLPLTDTDRVLDVGAGTGQLSLHLADAVGDVVVTDASEGMVAQARHNIAAAGLSDRMEALQLDLTTDDILAPSSFDGVWSMLAFHHVPALEDLLACVRDALRPGGWLAIVDLDRDEGGEFHAHVGDDFEGHHGFDRENLRRLLEAVGFVDVETSDAGVVDRELEGGDPEDGDHDGRTRAFPMFLVTATRG